VDRLCGIVNIEKEFRNVCEKEDNDVPDFMLCKVIERYYQRPQEFVANMFRTGSRKP
jgi:hypothetical protein